MGANASAELAATAARLRALGDRGLVKQFRAGVRLAAKPLVADVRKAALAQLPKSGGLNQHVAGQRITTSSPLSARSASVRLRMPFLDAVETDSGFVRKPVYGNRSVWVTQQIPAAAGWWSKTLANAGPEVTAALLVVMRAVDAEIMGRL